MYIYIYLVDYEFEKISIAFVDDYTKGNKNWKCRCTGCNAICHQQNDTKAIVFVASNACRDKWVLGLSFYIKLIWNGLSQLAEMHCILLVVQSRVAQSWVKLSWVELSWVELSWIELPKVELSL